MSDIVGVVAFQCQAIAFVIIRLMPRAK